MTATTTARSSRFPLPAAAGRTALGVALGGALAATAVLSLAGGDGQSVARTAPSAARPESAVVQSADAAEREAVAEQNRRFMSCSGASANAFKRCVEGR